MRAPTDQEEQNRVMRWGVVGEEWRFVARPLEGDRERATALEQGAKGIPQEAVFPDKADSIRGRHECPR